MARPTDYNEQLAALICERIADGQSLRSICSAEGMPDRGSVFRWLAKYPEFCNQYRHARETQADTIFDEMLDISDDGLNDWIERKGQDGQSIGWRENGEAIRRSDLRIKTRQWVLGRLAPKKYGEKQSMEVTGAGGEKLIPEETSSRDLAKAIAALLAKGMKTAE